MAAVSAVFPGKSGVVAAILPYLFSRVRNLALLSMLFFVKGFEYPAKPSNLLGFFGFESGRATLIRR